MITLNLDTENHSEFIEISARIEKVLQEQDQKDGLLYIFVPHTTAGLTINENADPTVRQDILAHLETRVPWEAGYRHAEGNSAAHIKASMLGSSLCILVSGGHMQLGTWQGVFFAEFDGPRHRRIWLHFQEDKKL